MKIVIEHHHTIGRRVFTQDVIKEGETIETNQAVWISDYGAERLRGTAMEKYLMYHEGAYCIPMGHIAFVEHSDNPNAEIRIQGACVELYAIKDIGILDPVSIRYPSLSDNIYGAGS